MRVCEELQLDPIHEVKMSHGLTILYEADMLRYTASKLSDGKFVADADRWVFLESFLTHFRNLVEFFGASQPQGRWKHDLRVVKPQDFWPDVNHPDAIAVMKLHRADLWEKYETESGEPISRFLHHCTAYRRETAKKWKIREMFEEMSYLLDEFERLLPDDEKVRPWIITRTFTLWPEASCSSDEPNLLEVGSPPGVALAKPTVQ
jgi:hypothetical protein